MESYNPNTSILPSAGGNIMAMRGGGVPMGYNPDVSVLPATSNSIPIVDMKGGDETLPMAAAATVVSSSGAVGPSTKTLTTTPKTPPKLEAKPPGKPIRFILFGEEFNAFSPDAANSPILALLGNLNDAEKSAALQEIYDGIVNLRTITLDASPHLKRLFIRMGIDYAKEKKELTEEPIHLEQTEIKLAFPNGKVEVTLTIKCDQLPSCSQKNLPMAAAATTMKGGDGERIIKLFGKEYTFPNRPTTINDHEDLLEELEVKEKGDTFKLTLLEEIYDGCYTDRSVISDIKCSTFGTLLEELGQKYAINIHELLSLNITAQKKGESIKQKKYPNGDLEFTFTFSNFGKQIGEETKKKIKAASEKAASSNGFFTKLTADPVSSNQVSIRGMVNLNNACFCISSIQLLFSIPQIRTIMKEYGKKNCNDAMLAEIYSQIEHPTITTVNNDGVLCALFHLFEELGENMTLFSRVKADILSDKNAVPYELLGYIMKNFEISRKGTLNAYQVGDQEDAQLFLTFLFEIFNTKGIKIQPLFQFTQKNIAATGVGHESHQDVWIIHNNFSASYPGTREIGGTIENYSVTLTLENNPYLLLRSSDPNANLSGMSHTLSIQKGKDNKEFKLYGMIRKSGDATSGHYVYDRQDLASNKHILYNDTAVTLFDNEIQMKAAGNLNAYLLVYAEVESPAKAPAAPASDLASDLASISASTSKSESDTTKMIRDLLSNKYNINELEKKYGGEDKCKPLWVAARKYAEAHQNEPVWMFVLGICNFYARGDIAENEKDAERFFKDAANKGLIVAMYMLGLIYSNNKEYTRAIPLWQRAADQGDAEAQYHLGILYHDGMGVTQNIKTANGLFKMAADQGHEEAKKTQLARMTGSGRTLRASKQSPKKKRTLRASKKLRQSSNKA